MKVAITGKGGVGKTTLSSTLARLYADEGRTVLAADVDPDANLGLALGLTQEEVDEIVPISKMRTLVEERTGANAANKFFKLNPYVADIPDTFSKDINGVKLLVMGTVEVGGTGCVCPEHVMLKSILSAMTYRKDDVVIMDMEAGLEHLGRGTAANMDQFIWRRNFGSTGLCTAVTILVYELAVFGVGIFQGLTIWARLGVFLTTALMSCIVMVPMYPIVRAIGKIGGDSWIE